MKLFLIITVLFLFFSCDLYNYDDEAAWSDWAFEEAPLSDKEEEFIDSLAKKKCHIEISRTYIGRIGKKDIRYELNILCDSLIVTHSNKDSIDRVRRQIVNAMYANVISDSVIFDMDRISTILSVYKLNIVKESESFTLKYYFIDSLEQWNGFKVVKIGKDNYKRVPVKKCNCCN